MQPRRLGISAALAVALSLLCGQGVASAATITVSSTDDAVAADGGCTLREAIRNANMDAASFPGVGECGAGSGPDRVVVPAGTYQLGSGDLDVTTDMTIDGAGAASTIVESAVLERVFEIFPVTVVLEDLTITGGKTEDSEDQPPVEQGDGTGAAATGGAGLDAERGGGINNVGNLTLRRVRVVGNATGSGGDGGAGIGGGGALGGMGGDGRGGHGGFGGNGGGIYNAGTLSVIDSVISDNRTGTGGNGGAGFGGRGGTGTAGGAGGNGATGIPGFGGFGGSGPAIFSEGTLIIVNSRLTGNSAGDGGDAGGAAGGAGGSGSGGGTGGAGGDALDGFGGGGGGAGAIYATGPTTITGSVIAGNAAGDAGAGSGASGGRGGEAGPTGGNAGDGGDAFAGGGGAGGSGGAIVVTDELTITGSTFDANSAGRGGDGGSATGGAGPSAVLPDGNGGDGGIGRGGRGGPGGDSGAIKDFGAGLIENATITGNATGAGGPGGTAKGGDAGSGVGSGDGGNGGNSTEGPGGSGGAAAAASLLSTMTLTVRHATISSNTAGAGGAVGAGTPGGAGSGSPGGSLGANVSSPAGAAGHGGVVGDALFFPILANSIVAHNAEPNCANVDDGGHNVGFPDSTCPGVNADPLLGELQDLGGPTPTQPLGAGSAALDRVPAAGAACAATDQRGTARPVGAACDAGAFESAAPAVVTGSASALTQSTARLGGSVNPNLKATSWHFEYGPTAAYGSTTPSGDAGAGGAAIDVGADVGGLSPGTTYHFRLVAANGDGARAGADQTFTPGDRLAPVLESASLRPKSFAVNRRGAPERAVTSQRRRRVRRGTRFRYRLSEAARVVFTIQRARAGRRVGGRCRKPTPANQARRRCTRWVRAGRFAQQSDAGANRKRFSGRIGRRALKRGRHRAVLVAADAAGNRSRARRLKFRVVRAR